MTFMGTTKLTMDFGRELTVGLKGLVKYGWALGGSQGHMQILLRAGGEGMVGYLAPGDLLVLNFRPEKLMAAGLRRECQGL